VPPFVPRALFIAFLLISVIYCKVRVSSRFLAEKSGKKGSFTMNKIICENYGDFCRVAADIFTEQLERKPESVLGLATGSTPIGLYEELVIRYNEGKIDFSRAKAFNLDEYYPIKANHAQSYKMFMEQHLFSKVKFAQTNIPNGEAPDASIECAKYDADIEAAGGIDLQLLGIGTNGHIGFNEPSVSYSLGSYKTKLTEATLTANSRFFGESETQPVTALTMGIGQIFSAKFILLLISGANKTEVTKKLFEGKLHTDIPASLLLLHPNLTIIIDKSAVEIRE
jgi:glucosamine-6-phosphate deaminase